MFVFLRNSWKASSNFLLLYLKIDLHLRYFLGKNSVTQMENDFVHFGFIHNVIWQGFPLQTWLWANHFFVLGEELFVCEILISLGSELSLRISRHEIQTWFCYVVCGY